MARTATNLRAISLLTSSSVRNTHKWSGGDALDIALRRGLFVYVYYIYIYRDVGKSVAPFIHLELEAGT